MTLISSLQLSLSSSAFYCLALCVLFDVIFSLSPCVHVRSCVLFPEFCNVEWTQMHSLFRVYDLSKIDW